MCENSDGAARSNQTAAAGAIGFDARSVSTLWISVNGLGASGNAAVNLSIGARCPALRRSILWHRSSNLIDWSTVHQCVHWPCVARSAVASPLLLSHLILFSRLQVQQLGQLGTSANAYTGVGQAIGKIAREEGVRAFWKGNGVNIIRIFPYSAAQVGA